MKHYRVIMALLCVLSASCGNGTKSPDPWGTGGQEAARREGAAMQLDDIMTNGELIMVTVSGPETYYEYRGRILGLHYLLCEEFCKSIGVSLRVDVCKDTAELIRRIESGEADMAAMPLTKTFDGLTECGSAASAGKWHWLVNAGNTSLAGKVDEWLTAETVEKTGKEQDYWLSPRSVTRHVYAPMQNRAKGIISDYDYLFRRYAPTVRWDWHLLAAQCYQESTFDPRAQSWAGACGLMQIMPATADHLQLARSEIFNPEKNVAAAAKYLAELTRLFADVDNPSERTKFVLASYNGGQHHIRDPMALTKKHGGNPHRWNDVKVYVLRLSMPAYYNDTAVKHGYMRGSETVAYVDNIFGRWNYYRGATTSPPKMQTPAPPAVTADPEPRPSAKRKDKYNL